MDVTVGSVSAAQAANLQMQVSNAVTVKARDIAEQQGAQMVEMIQATSLPPAAMSGSRIDTWA